MAGSVATLRGRVITAIDALTGWTPSRYVPELFGADVNQLMHHAFAVSVPDSTPVEQRQRVAEGLLVESTVEVRWAHRLRGDAQSTDYDGMADAEAPMVAAVLGITAQRCVCTSLAREASRDGWVVGTARFRVLHRIVLA